VINKTYYTGLKGPVTKSRVDEFDRFFNAENESDHRIFPARQILSNL